MAGSRPFAWKQIVKELKLHHNVEKLEDVRIIRDRQTSMFSL